MVGLIQSLQAPACFKRGGWGYEILTATPKMWPGTNQTAGSLTGPSDTLLMVRGKLFQLFQLHQNFAIALCHAEVSKEGLYRVIRYKIRMFLVLWSPCSHLPIKIKWINHSFDINQIHFFKLLFRTNQA